MQEAALAAVFGGMAVMELIIVTGLSGAGRHSVLGALEDAGCTALDNLPVPLLEPLLEVETKLNKGLGRLAVGMDTRHADFALEFPALLDRLQDRGFPVQVIFVEADDATLLRRFSESRRPHRMAPEGDVNEGIVLERELLEPVRARATATLDTSRLTLWQMRKRIQQLFPFLPGAGTTLRLLSFGFKGGLPLESDLVLDARFLPNPHYVRELRSLTGRDAPVLAYLQGHEAFGQFLALTEQWIRWAWPQIQAEGRAYFTVSIGCTGGQHRSVALVEQLAARLERDVARLAVTHRELGD